MRLLPIVFAFALAAVIVWRWRRLGWPVRLAGAALSAGKTVVIVGGVVAGRGTLSSSCCWD